MTGLEPATSALTASPKWLINQQVRRRLNSPLETPAFATLGVMLRLHSHPSAMRRGLQRLIAYIHTQQ